MSTRRQDRPAKPDCRAGFIRTRRLELEDEDGVVRAALFCEKDTLDAVRVQLYGPKGQLGLSVACSEEGAWVDLHQVGPGDATASLTVRADGQATLTLSDGLGPPVAVLDNRRGEAS